MTTHPGTGRKRHPAPSRPTELAEPYPVSDFPAVSAGSVGVDGAGRWALRQAMAWSRRLTACGTDTGLLGAIGRTTRYRRWARPGGCRVVGPMPACRALSVERAAIGRHVSPAGPPGGMRGPPGGATGATGATNSSTGRATRAATLTEFSELWPFFSAAPGVAASFPGRGEVCQGSNLFEPAGPRSALDTHHLG